MAPRKLIYFVRKHIQNQLPIPWDFLVKGDEGCIGPSGVCCCVNDKPKIIMQHMHVIISYKCDYCLADPVAHLLLRKSSMPILIRKLGDHFYADWSIRSKPYCRQITCILRRHSVITHLSMSIFLCFELNLLRHKHCFIL